MSHTSTVARWALLDEIREAKADRILAALRPTDTGANHD